MLGFDILPLHIRQRLLTTRAQVLLLSMVGRRRRRRGTRHCQRRWIDWGRWCRKRRHFHRIIIHRSRRFHPPTPIRLSTTQTRTTTRVTIGRDAHHSRSHHRCPAGLHWLQRSETRNRQRHHHRLLLENHPTSNRTSGGNISALQNTA